MTTSRRRVVLHFDLNRTVLMSDAAGGRSMENTVNYLLSECTYGRVEASQWHCVSSTPSVVPPAESLITYKQFVDDLLPYKSLQDHPTTELEAIKAFNKAAKKQRTALQSAFTSQGSPGESIAESFTMVMDKLHFPPGSQRDTAQRLATTLPSSKLQEAWQEGRYYLLPSFLQFLAFVAQQNASPTSTVDIRLVFRTFGDDIPDVAKELELLVDGTHPFPLATPLPATFKLVLSGDQVGTFYRDGFEADGTALAVGSLTKLPFTKDHQADAKALETFYQPPVEIVRGFSAIHTRVQQMLMRHTTIALRDYWEWWSAHAEAGEYGKLLLVETEKNETTVFLDDHIEAHHAHIVDVRDVTTGTPVTFDDSIQRHFLQRVEPYAAITDDQYFIKLLAPLLQ